MSLRVCFDLDGTLCRTEGMDYEHAEPIPERIAAVKRLIEEGAEVSIQTARGSGERRDGIELMTIEQLRDWGLGGVRVEFGKVAADVYVDDRAMGDTQFFRLCRWT